jgi:hypothetical protein
MLVTALGRRRLVNVGSPNLGSQAVRDPGGVRGGAEEEDGSESDERRVKDSWLGA